MGDADLSGLIDQLERERAPALRYHILGALEPVRAISGTTGRLSSMASSWYSIPLRRSDG